MEAKLAGRRQRKAELAKALMEKQAVIGWEDEERKILNKKMAQDIENKQKQDEEDANQVDISLLYFTLCRNINCSRSKYYNVAITLEFQSTVAGPEHDWVNMIMNSPLFKQANDINELLENADFNKNGSKDVKGKLHKM